MCRTTGGTENGNPERRWPYIAEDIRLDVVALMLDVQFACVLLEAAARMGDRIEVAKMNKEIHETAGMARERLREAGIPTGRRGRTPRWPDYAEGIRLECINLSTDIMRATELLEDAAREKKTLKVAAINDLIYRLARRIQNTLNDPERFERGDGDGT